MHPKDPYNGDPGPFTNRDGWEYCSLIHLRKDILQRRIREQRILGHETALEKHDFQLYNPGSDDDSQVYYRCTKCYARREVVR